jgi:glycosyltransferase involved in cell wall biosynthesis
MEIIHIVLGKANPQRMNGVNKVVYQLATRQAASGRNVSVWGITKTLDQNFGERNFETQLYKAHRNPFKVDKLLKADLAKKKGKAVFHLHGGWIPVFATLSKVLSNLKIPFVLTPHGAYNTIAMKRSWWSKKIYFILFEKKLLKRVSKIHCIGESEVTGLNEIFQTDKTFLMPYGFEPSIGNASKVVKHDKQFIIGFVGRLDIHTKGLDLLLNAFEDFNGRCPKASIWIVGDSDERVNLERMILEKHLEKTVILWGSKFGIEKDDLMKQMDAFVHPSRNEGLPSAVLEASSLGVPCVVSQATNVGQYIQQYNAGYVVRNEDHEELRIALEKLCELKAKNQLEELGNNGQKMVEEVFNWKHIVIEFDRLYTLA